MTGALAALRTLDESRHRAEFYRMWASGYAAGFTHPKSFETMGPRQSRRTEGARQYLLDGTARGEGLKKLVRAGGSRFDTMEAALIGLGDDSGRLDESLRLLGDYYTRKHKLMLWVKKKMAYPFFTGLFACVIAPLQLLLFGHERAYFAIAGSGIAAILLGSGAIVAATAAHYGRKPALVRARMARSLATAIEAGLPLDDALVLAANASDSPEIRGFVLRQKAQTLATQSLGESLAGCPHMTPEFAAILATSERTGDFGALRKLADLYEDGFR